MALPESRSRQLRRGARHALLAVLLAASSGLTAATSRSLLALSANGDSIYKGGDLTLPASLNVNNTSRMPSGYSRLVRES